MEKITTTLSRGSIFESVQIVGSWEPGLNRSEKTFSGVLIHRLGLSLFRSRVINRTLKLFSLYLHSLWKFRNSQIQAVNAHSLSVFPLCYTISRMKRCALIYDTHELETETSSMRGIVKIFAKLCEKVLIRKSTAIFVVSREIEDWYRDKYGMSNIHTIPNLPYRYQEKSLRKQIDLRTLFSLPSGTKIIVYVGYISKGRGLEPLVKAMSYFSIDQLVLVLIGNGPLENSLKDNSGSNIFYLPFVPNDDLIPLLTQADFGALLIDGERSLSYRLSAPNKLFEYLAAQLTVVATKLPAFLGVANSQNSFVFVDQLDEFNVQLALSRAIYQSQQPRGSLKDDNTLFWDSVEPELLAIYKNLIRANGSQV
jgi:glycosyltransferase involved in cell wall biosynthesis